MLGNRRFISDTFCEVHDLLEPWIDDSFYEFEHHSVVPGAVYMINRAQVNRNADKVRQIAEDGQVTVIVSNPTEGSETLKQHMHQLGYTDLCLQGKILLLGGGDMESDYHYLAYDNFLPKVFDYSENTSASKYIDDIFSKIDKPYKFLFFNGRSRPARQYLLHAFQHQGLLDHALWTNLQSRAGTPHKIINLPVDGRDLMLEPFPVKRLDARYELERYRENLDREVVEEYAKPQLFQRNGAVEWGDIYIHPDPYIDTYFSVITETVFTYPYSFRTEKLWKPVAMGHPFIVVANQGYYRDLHNLGFRTFGHVIDESFDAIENNLERLQRINDVVRHLCSQDLGTFLAATQEVCEHNQAHLWHMRDQVRQEFPSRFHQFMIDQGVIQ